MTIRSGLWIDVILLSLSFLVNPFAQLIKEPAVGFLSASSRIGSRVSHDAFKHLV